MGYAVKFMPANVNRGNSAKYYKNGKAIDNLASYAWPTEHLNKTQVSYFGGNYLDLSDRRLAIKQIKKAQKIYDKTSDRRMYHYILSFDKLIRNAEAVRAIAEAVMKEYFSEYQILYVVHVNTNNLHIHFIFSSVSIETGKKFSLRRTEYREMEAGIEELALEYLKEQGVIFN